MELIGSDILLSNVVFLNKSSNISNKDLILNNFSKILDDLVNKGMSTSLKELLLEIKTKVQNNVDSAFVLNLVNDLKKFNGNSTDAAIINSFTQVYNSSYEYWNANGLYKKNMEEGDGVIIADAIGAAYGAFWLPPFGSIIQGALFSIIANNQ